MLFIVRAARSMGLSVGGAGNACGCCGSGCDMEDWRCRPGRCGAGVLMNAPGPCRCGVAGGIWYAIVGCRRAVRWRARPLRARERLGGNGEHAPAAGHGHELCALACSRDAEETEARESWEQKGRRAQLRSKSSASSCRSKQLQGTGIVGVANLARRSALCQPNFLAISNRYLVPPA